MALRGLAMSSGSRGPSPCATSSRSRAASRGCGHSQRRGRRPAGERPHAAALGRAAGGARGIDEVVAPGPLGLVAHDRRDRHDDHRAGHEHHRRDLSPSTAQPEHHGDHRVDVGVGDDLRDRGVLQQPGVGAVADERADQDEVDERPQRTSPEKRRRRLRRARPPTARRPSSRGLRRASASPSPPGGAPATTCAGRSTSRSPTTSRRARGTSVPHSAHAVGAVAGKHQQRDAGEPVATPSMAAAGADRRSRRGTRRSTAGSEAMISAASADGTSSPRP